MKRALYKYTYLIPPIQLIATLLVALFPNYTSKIAVILGNSIGYSILTSLVYIKHFWITNKKYCLFTKASVFGVSFLAVFNTLGYYVYSEKYYTEYEKGLTLIAFLLTLFLLIVLYIQKRK